MGFIGKFNDFHDIQMKFFDLGGSTPLKPSNTACYNSQGLYNR